MVEGEGNSWFELRGAVLHQVVTWFATLSAQELQHVRCFRSNAVKFVKDLLQSMKLSLKAFASWLSVTSCSPPSPAPSHAASQHRMRRLRVPLWCQLLRLAHQPQLAASGEIRWGIRKIGLPYLNLGALLMRILLCRVYIGARLSPVF